MRKQMSLSMKVTRPVLPLRGKPRHPVSHGKPGAPTRRFERAVETVSGIPDGRIEVGA